MRKAIGWRLQQRLIPLRTWMLAVPVVRQIYRALYRVLEIWVDEGFLKIFSRAGHKVSLALRGRNFLVEGADRRTPRVEDQYEQWMARSRRAPEPGEMLAAIGPFRERPLVSVLVCVDTVEPERLRRLIATLRAQSYERGSCAWPIPRAAHRAERELDRDGRRRTSRPRHERQRRRHTPRLSGSRPVSSSAS